MKDLDELSRVIGQIEGTQKALLTAVVETKAAVAETNLRLSHIEEQYAGHRVETAKTAGTVSVLLTLVIMFFGWINPFK